MKLLPIVPGCRAVVINTISKFACYRGREVTVGRKIRGPDLCMLCRKPEIPWEIRLPDDRLVAQCECSLLRIDGGDFSKERETGKIKERA